MALGPQQMPPQGARALIGALLGGRRGGPEVSAVLDEAQSRFPSIEFLNEGTGPAVDLRYAVEDRSGTRAARPLGDLGPGATVRAELTAAPPEPFRCVWVCQDFRGRARAWSYDGRRKRLRGTTGTDAESAFRALYDD
jgi:hypothetical protein